MWRSCVSKVKEIIYEFQILRYFSVVFLKFLFLYFIITKLLIFMYVFVWWCVWVTLYVHMCPIIAVITCRCVRCVFYGFVSVCNVYFFLFVFHWLRWSTISFHEHKYIYWHICVHSLHICTLPELLCSYEFKHIHMYFFIVHQTVFEQCFFICVHMNVLLCATRWSFYLSSFCFNLWGYAKKFTYILMYICFLIISNQKCLDFGNSRLLCCSCFFIC